jgi:prevent-host-death family protein
MTKTVSASHAKNNFGGLLDDVTALGRVEIHKHGRLVAVVLSPHAFEELGLAARGAGGGAARGETHMIPPRSARAARMLRAPSGFDEE